MMNSFSKHTLVPTDEQTSKKIITKFQIVDQFNKKLHQEKKNTDGKVNHLQFAEIKDEEVQANEENFLNESEECEENYFNYLINDELRELSLLKAENQKLLRELDLLKLMDFNDDKKVDMKIFGLPYKRQNKILINRFAKFKLSKNLGRKVLSKLQEELNDYKEKAFKASIEVINNKDFLNLCHSQHKQIELEINQEIQEVERKFLKSCNKKKDIKNKYFKIEDKLRNIILPRLEKLSKSLIESENELKEIKIQIGEKKQGNRENKIDENNEEQEDDDEVYKSIKNENKTMEINNRELKKSITKIKSEIESCKKNFKNNNQDLKENALIYRRMKEISVEKLEKELNELKNSTKTTLDGKDEEIDELTLKICKIRSQISDSNCLISCLLNDKIF